MAERELKSYYEVVIEEVRRNAMFFWGDSIVADRAIIKGDDVIVLVSGAKTRLSQKRWGKS